MIHATLAVMVVLFVEAAAALHVIDTVKGILASTKGAMAVLASAEDGDDAKERAARAGAVAILRCTVLFAVRLAAVLAIVLIPFATVTLLTPVSPSQFTDAAVSSASLAGATAFGALYAGLRHVRRR